MINEAHNKTQIAVWAELRRLMNDHPDAKIVTEFVDTSYEDTYCDERELSAVIYHPKLNKIQLVFD